MNFYHYFDLCGGVCCEQTDYFSTTSTMRILVVEALMTTLPWKVSNFGFSSIGLMGLGGIGAGRVGPGGIGPGSVGPGGTTDSFLAILVQLRI